MTAPKNATPPLPSAASPTVGIRQASRATRMDFARLMAQAQEESGFRVDAKSKSGSATGLFQFISSTWLGLVQRFGERYGVGALAQQIETDPSGRPGVADPATRQRILDLRKDPALSAALAAEYARVNKAEIEQALARPASNPELYLAHFLSAAGATALLKAVERNGDAVGAELLPASAAANRAVFFDGQGRPRTVAEIYGTFAQRVESEAERFSGTGNAGDGAAATTPDVPRFIRRLGFDGHQLSEPTIAMLNAIALSALQLLAGPRPAAARATAARRSR
jgi:hypothetical protein